MQRINLATNLTSSLFLILSFLFSTNVISQTANLSEDFLEGLPPSVRDQIEVQNTVDEEKDLEDLFRSDTSIEKKAEANIPAVLYHATYGPLADSIQREGFCSFRSSK